MTHPMTKTEAELVSRYSEVRKRLGMVSEPVRIPRPRPIYLPKPRDFLNLYDEEIIPETPQEVIANMSWKPLLQQVALKHKITVTELRSKNRSRHLVAARKEACYRLVHDLGMTFAATARRMGYHEHTAVMYASDQYAKSIGKKKRKPLVDNLQRRERNEEVIRRLNAGEITSAIAKSMGLRPQNVRHIGVKMGFDFQIGKQDRYRRAMEAYKNAR